MNLNKLKGKMAEKGVTQTELAKRMGMATNTMSKKMNGQSDFKLSELIAILKILDIENPKDIFLS